MYRVVSSVLIHLDTHSIHIRMIALPAKLRRNIHLFEVTAADDCISSHRANAVITPIAVLPCPIEKFA